MSRTRIHTLYRSDIQKKYVMAVTGIVLMGYVLLHMLGNLKLYLGAEDLNHYAEWLRDVGEPLLPHAGLLWILRVVLLGALILHLDAAFRLAKKSRAARAVPYAAKRKHVEADFASRTMRWTGPIVLLFVIFHLLDLTWGTANPDFTSGDPYDNIVASFERVPVALVYIAANIALAYHLYHGSWSLFQSLGIGGRNARVQSRRFAWVFAIVIAVGNISFPIAVLTGAVG